MMRTEHGVQAMKTVTLRCIFCLEPNPVNLNEGCDERLCTKCSKPFLMDRPVRINQEDFKMTVLDSELPVLVDFYADWCGPCKMVNPIIDDIARLRQGELIVGKIDADRAQDLMLEIKVTSVPTLILFKNGIEVSRSVGLEPQKIKEMAESAIQKELPHG